MCWLTYRKKGGVMFEDVKTVQCMACKEGQVPLTTSEARCESCNSELGAMVYLVRRGILPQDMHDELYLRPKYAGISFDVAKKLVTIFKDCSDQPN